ncbi:chromosome-associated kinesin KIF4A-like [Mizuhopecten yessoensis]|uniref:Chromosome-associated kinesin KIF4A n=1 Tax=Mizuhopecten yessoensis TaxID=6573 RepID=A0A210Q4U4_MIZYE|nr:chromosome-associated kinesin KIF4A-like [Mizuhopecten yessoensis]XP_021367041.1 chromosome-associated kinesin KIF4A-like [Mizuhopecten yessoensis]OWF43762.1 Chromosome-associated kinesin KIF4A [Mizuhopecten yessoensis]
MSDKVIPVRVAVRCRPLIQKEENEGCQKCVQFTKNEPQIILGKMKAFTYDYVFSPCNSQSEVYEMSVHPLIKHIFKGYNATVLAYGQTGSGKTFSMGGCYEESLKEEETAMGIIPRVLNELFQGILARPDYDFVTKVSYIEIHNEDINDLLRPPNRREPLSIREDTEGGIKLPGLQEVVVKSYKETMQCLTRGSQSRTTGSTAMNNTSSRSHAIFTVTIEQKKQDDMNDFCKSKFYLVDLAGSERAKRTQAEGERFKEGININRGLLALGNVISALGEEASKRNHIPYRDSKLTRLLQDSLGGNSHTVMIACVSPADSNMEETLNTLRYADRARKIKNKPIVNRDPQTEEIMRLKSLVQKLQLQLIGGGATCPDSISTISTCSSTTSVESSAEELRAVMEKNKHLEEENGKLATELTRAVDQSTNLCEKAIRMEMKCDKLKSRLQNLKKDTGLDLEVLSSSVDVESNPVLKEQLDKLKNLADKMQADSSEEDKDLETDAVSEEEEDEDEEGQESTPGTPQSRALSNEYALRQARMNRELLELNKLLEKKEHLASQMTRSDEHMDVMKKQFESALKDLEIEVSVLQKEKDDMQSALDSARVNSNVNKVAEQRRKRLKELEQQITDLRKKMNEQTRLLKMKDSSDKQVSKLNTEILDLKHHRVKLMKLMKEESETFRKWKQKKDKEVLQLMQKDRKRQCEIAKLQRENQKQSSVLKRKSEEAAAANKRLKEALAKQKQVLAERSSKLQQSDASSIGNRVRTWLSHEFEIRVSIREAKYHLESLLTDRKTLTEQLRQLKVKIGEEPPKKKFAWENSDCYRVEGSFEEESTKNQIQVVEQEINLRNAQISDLQQKIVDADQNCKGKATWESLHTMTEAKCGMKWLLEQAVTSRVDVNRAQGELRDSQINHVDKKEEITALEKTVTALKKKHDAAMTELQKKNEEKVLYLLQRVKNTAGDGDSQQTLQIQQQEIEKLSKYHEDLLLKTEECDNLKKQLTKATYQNKALALMPDIENPESSPFFSPEIKKKKRSVAQQPKTKSTGRLLTYEEHALDWEQDNEDDLAKDDDENDPDWVKTPIYTRNTRKPRKTMIRDSRRHSIEDLQNDLCNNKDVSNEATSFSSLNSTYNLEENAVALAPPAAVKSKRGRPSKRILDNIVSNKSVRSSDEFESLPQKSLSADDSENSTLSKGAKQKKRKLLSTNNSFFSPLV